MSANWLAQFFQNHDNKSCKYDTVVWEESLTILPTFTQGILVGGHILVMIFSGCGNIAALIIVVKSKAPKLSTKYFLIMLALSDLLMTAIAPPTEISKMMHDFNEWIFGALMCKLVPFFQLVSATMSAMCLMAIAAERNFLIVRAMSPTKSVFNKLWHKWIVPGMAIAIILLPIGCGLPQVWYYSSISFLAIPKGTKPTTTEAPTPTTEEPTSTTQVSSSPSTMDYSVFPCDIRHWCMRSTFDEFNIIYWSVTGSIYLFLLVCFLMSYISIYIFVKKHGQFKKQLESDYNSITAASTAPTSASKRNTDGQALNKSKFAAGERHRKTLKLILWLILLHLVCRTPSWIYNVITNVVKVPLTKATFTLLETFHLLSTVNCALNPFLYVIWNHSLRANDPGNGGMSSVKRKSNVLCRKTGNILRTMFCCCCKYKEENINDHLPVDPVIQQASSSWSWKTPTIYHIADDDANKGNSKVKMTSSQAYYIEKCAI